MLGLATDETRETIMPAALTPFGRTLRELRRSVHQTTADMAADLAMSGDQLLHYELGLHNLDLDLVENCLLSLGQWQPEVDDDDEVPPSLAFGSVEKLRIAAFETPFYTPVGRLLQTIESFGYDAAKVMLAAGIDKNFNGTFDKKVGDAFIAAVQEECGNLFDERLSLMFGYYFADGRDADGEMVHSTGVNFGIGFKRTPLAELMEKIRQRYRINMGDVWKHPGAKDYKAWRNGQKFPDQAGINAFIAAIKAHEGAAGHDEIAMLHHYAGIPFDPR